MTCVQLQTRWQLMGHSITVGKRQYAFTLIELLLVLVLLALLASMVLPNTVRSIDQARESVLKENLHILRKSIDDYYSDHGHYPETLEQLVTSRYIRRLPKDPVMEDSSEWELVFRDDGEKRGIVDVHSMSSRPSSDGSPYNTW